MGHRKGARTGLDYWEVQGSSSDSAARAESFLSRFAVYAATEEDVRRAVFDEPPTDLWTQIEAPQEACAPTPFVLDAQAYDSILAMRERSPTGAEQLRAMRDIMTRFELPTTLKFTVDPPIPADWKKI